MSPDDPKMEPVHVTVVGGTGSGETTTREIVTTDGQPNIIATFIPTAKGLFARWLDTFLNSFLAISGVGAVANIEAIKALIPTHAALGSSIMEEAVFYAFVGATFQLLKN